MGNDMSPGSNKVQQYIEREMLTEPEVKKFSVFMAVCCHTQNVTQQGMQSASVRTLTMR
jgi:hypothetical protein